MQQLFQALIHAVLCLTTFVSVDVATVNISKSQHNHSAGNKFASSEKSWQRNSTPLIYIHVIYDVLADPINILPIFTA